MCQILDKIRCNFWNLASISTRYLDILRLPLGDKSASETFTREDNVEIVYDIVGAEAIVNDILIWEKRMPLDPNKT